MSRPSTGAPAGAGEDLLRSVIRDVLGDLLGDATQRSGLDSTLVPRVGSTNEKRSPVRRPSVVEEVREGRANRLETPHRQRGNVAIATQADLDALVRRVLADSADPAARAAWERGQLRATLGTAAPAAPSAAASAAPSGGAIRVERGAVTERIVQQAARAGAQLVIGPRAVLTPLAKERARRAGVQIRRDDTTPAAGPGTRR